MITTTMIYTHKQQHTTTPSLSLYIYIYICIYIYIYISYIYTYIHVSLSLYIYIYIYIYISLSLYIYIYVYIKALRARPVLRAQGPPRLADCLADLVRNIQNNIYLFTNQAPTIRVKEMHSIRMTPWAPAERR